jgi:hypothetical protein
VDVDFTVFPVYLEGPAEREFYRDHTEAELKVWKSRLIEVLKDSPSKERKFLKWKVYGYDKQTCYGMFRYVEVVIWEGELEVID